MSFGADFRTLFIYKPVMGFCTRTDTPEFYYEDDAHDFVKRNQNTIANIIKISAYLPVFGIVKGICHLAAYNMASSKISPNHQQDLPIRAILIDITISGICGLGITALIVDCIITLTYTTYSPRVVITHSKIRSILDHNSDPEILNKKLGSLRILNPKNVPEVDRKIWKKTHVDAFPYYSFSAQKDIITYFLNEDEILKKYEGDLNLLVNLSKILLDKGVVNKFNALFDDLKKSDENLKRFIQLSTSHPVIMNHLIDLVDYKMAENLELLPFQSPKKIREHFEKFTELSVLDQNITIIDDDNTHYLSTYAVMANALQYIPIGNPDFGLQLLKQIPYEHFCLYIKGVEDREILNQLLSILPHYYLKSALVLIDKEIAIEFMYKNIQCVKIAPLELKKQLIPKMKPEDFKVKLQIKEIRDTILASFTVKESDEELEAQVKQFSEELEALQKPITQAETFEIPDGYYDCIGCHVIEIAVKVPTGQYIDAQTFQSLKPKENKIRNPFDNLYYPEEDYIFDIEHQKKINAWKEKNLETLRANDLLQRQEIPKPDLTQTSKS